VVLRQPRPPLPSRTNIERYELRGHDKWPFASPCADAIGFVDIAIMNPIGRVGVHHRSGILGCDEK